MAAAINRWIFYALLAIGVAIIVFGLYFGMFAWANDGLVVGLRLFGMCAAFGAALVLTGFAFRYAAAAHAARAQRRWWIQALAVVVGYVAFGAAASLTSLLDRM